VRRGVLAREVDEGTAVYRDVTDPGSAVS